MRQASDYFEGFLGEDFESYCEEMEEPGTWGDELTLVGSWSRSHPVQVLLPNRFLHRGPVVALSGKSGIPPCDSYGEGTSRSRLLCVRSSDREPQRIASGPRYMS